MVGKWDEALDRYIRPKIEIAEVNEVRNGHKHCSALSEFYLRRSLLPREVPDLWRSPVIAAGVGMWSMANLPSRPQDLCSLTTTHPRKSSLIM